MSSGGPNRYGTKSRGPAGFRPAGAAIAMMLGVACVAPSVRADPVSPAAERSGLADTLDALRIQGRHREMIALAKSRLEMALARGDGAAVAALRYVIGDALFAEKEYREACRQLICGLRNVKDGDLPGMLGAFYNGIGGIKKYEERNWKNPNKSRNLEEDGDMQYSVHTTCELTDAEEKGQIDSAHKIEYCKYDINIKKSDDINKWGAKEYFLQALNAARAEGDRLTAASAHINLATTTHLDSPEAALRELRGAVGELEGVEKDFERASSALEVAGTALDLDIRTAGGRLDRERHAIVEAALDLAGRSAGRLRDGATTSRVAGIRARMLERRGRSSEALLAVNDARAALGNENRPDLLFEWSELEARIQSRLGRGAAALAAYRRAAVALQAARRDLVETIDDQGRSSVRREYRDFERRLVTALFAEADARLRVSTAPSDATVQRVYGEILEASEKFRAAELAEYLGDPCAIDDSTAGALPVLPSTAKVIYPIILPDRLEILLKSESGVVRTTSRISEAALVDTANTLIESLAPGRADIGIDREASRRLYGWLIRPIERHLEPGDVLVFVPDGILRRLPYAALMDSPGDRDRYVIERWSVAVSPGLGLLPAKPTRGFVPKILIGGTGTFRGPDGDLPAVGSEIERISAEIPGSIFRDANFTAGRITTALKERSHSIVHMASHANFGAPKERYVAMYDGRMSIDDFAAAVRDGTSRANPIELLTLSACEAAKGDDRVVLGLAGVAVRAGVRSVLATLWKIADVSTPAIMARFYGNLTGSGMGRAQALREAQLALMEGRLDGDAKHRSPTYWAPYVLVGDWR